MSEKRVCCFDGVFTTNDMMALGTIHALAEAGYSVPGQVKIVGFDNVSLSEFCNPPMTTIAQDTEQMALAAGLFRGSAQADSKRADQPKGICSSDSFGSQEHNINNGLYLN